MTAIGLTAIQSNSMFSSLFSLPHTDCSGCSSQDNPRHHSCIASSPSCPPFSCFPYGLLVLTMCATGTACHHDLGALGSSTGPPLSFLATASAMRASMAALATSNCASKSASSCGHVQSTCALFQHVKILTLHCIHGLRMHEEKDCALLDVDQY